MILIDFILAMLPIFWLIISLSKLKMNSCKACGIALLITVILAALYWKLPPLHISSAIFEGAAYALWPICLIIVAALFTYNLTIKTGAMEKIKGMLIGISDDKRILMLIIGCEFGNFMEGMAGFGTAVAIPASILAGIGLNPINAVTACLVVNTTPTAFGSAGVPTATLASITGLDLQQLAANAALIQAVHTFLSPFLAVVICGGGVKALKGVWHITLVASLSFLVPYLLFAYLLGPELPTIVGSICSMLCVILVAKFGKRKRNEAHGTAKIESEYSVKTAAAEITVPATHIGFAEGLRAWAPFMLIFVLLILTS